MDADFSHKPQDIPRLMAALEDADFVIGSRYVAGGSTSLQRIAPQYFAPPDFALSGRLSFARSISMRYVSKAMPFR